MKQNLIKAGFASWDNPTTYFGPSTERAVKRFQSYYSLSTDGMMGPESLAKLNNIINSPFQRGKRSAEIQDLKMGLLIIGEASWNNPTTYYGPETERVVRGFQRGHDLVVNGIIDDKTYDKIKSLEKTRPMKKGQRNSAVLNFKNQLIKLGFASWDNPTTYYGPSTERAVKGFQSYFGLKDDGLMDYESRSILKAAANTPYQKGKSGKDIQKVKNDLVFLGYASWSSPTTYFGPDTVRVVKNFQEQNNLIVNGLIDDVTLNKITALKNAPLKYGVRRPDVLEFKQKLIKLNFASWENPTTYFGPSTRNAVESFQEYYNLAVDGIMGPSSLQTLNTAINSSYQRGKKSQAIKEIKYKLKSIGFGEHWENPTTNFGPDTERVVKEFQKNMD